MRRLAPSTSSPGPPGQPTNTVPAGSLPPRRVRIYTIIRALPPSALHFPVRKHSLTVRRTAPFSPLLPALVCQRPSGTHPVSIVIVRQSLTAGRGRLEERCRSLAETVEHYRAQVRAYLELTGADRCLIVMMTGGRVVQIRGPEPTDVMLREHGADVAEAGRDGPGRKTALARSAERRERAKRR